MSSRTAQFSMLRLFMSITAICLGLAVSAGFSWSSVAVAHTLACSCAVVIICMVRDVGLAMSLAASVLLSQVVVGGEHARGPALLMLSSSLASGITDPGLIIAIAIIVIVFLLQLTALLLCNRKQIVYCWNACMAVLLAVWMWSVQGSTLQATDLLSHSLFLIVGAAFVGWAIVERSGMWGLPGH